MRIKVLELDSWMENDIHPEWRCGNKLLGSDRYPEIRPVFNRPGIYKIGKQSWIEIAGKAYQFDHMQFHFDLEWKHALEYTDQEANALFAIARTRFATEKQRRLSYDIAIARESRAIYRNSRKHFARFMKEVKNGQR